MRKIFVFAFLSPLIFLECTFAEQCLKRRGVIDIGSTATKLNVSDVDVCKATILKKVHSENTRVAYKEYLSNSSTQSFFNEDIKNEGRLALVQLLSNAKRLDPPVDQFSAVATSAFREAKNGEAFASDLETEFSFPVKVISQEEEARLGVQAVLHSSEDGKSSFVLDIGGGSMQLTGFGSEKNQKLSYNAKFGAEVFKQWIIKNVKKKKGLSSPNPLSKKEKEKALAYVKSFFLKNIPRVLKKEVVAKKVNIIGLGGVLTKCMKPILAGQKIRSSAVKRELGERLGLDDGKIRKRTGSAFYATEVSNYILVLGLMDVLRIESIDIKDLEATEGILTEKSYWREAP